MSHIEVGDEFWKSVVDDIFDFGDEAKPYRWICLSNCGNFVTMFVIFSPTAETLVTTFCHQHQLRRSKWLAKELIPR